VGWIFLMTSMPDQKHGNYHVPISNTGAGLMLFENAA